jgi:Sigma-70, region 4
MDELEEFCARVLGEGHAAERAVQRARRPGDDRTQALTRAVLACREATGGNGGDLQTEDAEPSADSAGGLVAAVASELARASARLNPDQREILALRQLGCSHSELANVVGIETSAVAPLLARARLRLRAEIRGGQNGPTDCPERDRALRTIALRQDGEEVPEADEDWLLDHLGHCAGCAQVHAAMLEASACYRAWRVAPAP